MLGDPRGGETGCQDRGWSVYDPAILIPRNQGWQGRALGWFQVGHAWKGEISMPTARVRDIAGAGNACAVTDIYSREFFDCLRAGARRAACVIVPLLLDL